MPSGRRQTPSGSPLGSPLGSPPGLPSPGVEFPPELIRRFGAFAGRLAAAREREDVGSKRALRGEGQEFVGHRPYRPGEDLRQLDWQLLARLDRPFVRVQRSNVSESWVVVIDTSASMGIGVPGKLQSAAEAAAACISLGVRLGASIKLVWQDSSGELRIVEVRRAMELRRVLTALSALRAHGVSEGPHAGGGLESLLDGPRAALPSLVRKEGGAGRVILLGDFLDVDQGSLLRALGGRRRLHLGQVLSPEEWRPSAAVNWLDPETGERRMGSEGGPDQIGGYHQRLDRFLEGWAAHAQTHGMAHAAWSSADPFERYLPGLLR